MIAKETRDTVKKGRAFKILYDDKNPNNETIHIAAIVDRDYAVIKTWRHQHWNYRVDWLYALQLKIESGAMKRVRRG